jgi:hypothetical protein
MPLYEKRKRGPPQCRPHLTTKAAGRLEAEASNALAMVQQHPERDAAPERMAHEVDLGEAYRVEPCSDDIRVPVERVARVRTRRLTIAAEVKHEDAPRACERGGYREPATMRVAEPVKENE